MLPFIPLSGDTKHGLKLKKKILISLSNCGIMSCRVEVVNVKKRELASKRESRLHKQ